MIGDEMIGDEMSGHQCNRLRLEFVDAELLTAKTKFIE